MPTEVLPRKGLGVLCSVLGMQGYKGQEVKPKRQRTFPLLLPPQCVVVDVWIGLQLGKVCMVASSNRTDPLHALQWYTIYEAFNIF